MPTQLVKTPLSQLMIDLSEMKKQTKNVDKAIASQTPQENDKVKLALEPFQNELRELIKKFEVSPHPHFYPLNKIASRLIK